MPRQIEMLYVAFRAEIGLLSAATKYVASTKNWQIGDTFVTRAQYTVNVAAD